MRGQARAAENLVRNRLMSDEFLDFVQENTKICIYGHHIGYGQGFPLPAASCAFTTLLNSFISISSFSPVIFYINNCEILSSGGLPCGGSGCGLSDTHSISGIKNLQKVTA